MIDIFNFTIMNFLVICKWTQMAETKLCLLKLSEKSWKMVQQMSWTNVNVWLELKDVYCS